MIKLYQFPISHYCEKVRWALEYKNIDYEVVNLLPGLHVSRAKKMAPHSYVPILSYGEKVIQGSNNIISFLDETFPENGLTPEGGSSEEALQWESYVDEELGPHVRRCCYHILLEYPDVVIDLLTQQGPFYGKPLLWLIFPLLKNRMRELMDIDARTAEESRRHIVTAVEKLYDHLQQHSYLVDSRFTRADLAAAALIAPLRMPKKYGLNWPAKNKIPAKFVELMEDFDYKTEWVDEVYEKYR